MYQLQNDYIYRAATTYTININLFVCNKKQNNRCALENKNAFENGNDMYWNKKQNKPVDGNCIKKETKLTATANKR